LKERSETGIEAGDVEEEGEEEAAKEDSQQEVDTLPSPPVVEITPPTSPTPPPITSRTPLPAIVEQQEAADELPDEPSESLVGNTEELWEPISDFDDILNDVPESDSTLRAKETLPPPVQNEG